MSGKESIKNYALLKERGIIHNMQKTVACLIGVPAKTVNIGYDDKRHSATIFISNKTPNEVDKHIVRRSKRFIHFLISVPSESTTETI